MYLIMMLKYLLQSEYPIGFTPYVNSISIVFNPIVTMCIFPSGVAVAVGKDAQVRLTVGLGLTSCVDASCEL